VRAEELAQFPYSGRVNVKYGDPNLREIVWGDYWIAYQIEAEVVVVLAVQHVARNRE